MEQSTIVLDLTRTLSRVGRGVPTGIDRVERAYLGELLASDHSAFGLARTAAGLCMLDRRGLVSLQAHLDGDTQWDAHDLAGRLSVKLTCAQKSAQATVRRLAKRTSYARRNWSRVWRDAGPSPIYLNVGHSNLDPANADATKAIGAQAAVLLHDVIPLRAPETQAIGGIQRFERKFRAALAIAHKVVTFSEAEASNIRAQARAIGFSPDVVVVPPFVQPANPAMSAKRPTKPFFTFVGTLEPRKNLSLILDVWGDLGPIAPGLCIIGQRGWEQPEVLARLDALKAERSNVFEFDNLRDAEVAALVADSEALLFPSIAEGYGFPPHEALCLDIPPIVAPLPVHHETLGRNAIYADINDRYRWAELVCDATALAQAKEETMRVRAGKHLLPSWQEHFQKVLRILTAY